MQVEGHDARAGADGQQKTTALLRALSLLLEDLLLLDSGLPELLRNIDLRPELDRLAVALSFLWIERASHDRFRVLVGGSRTAVRRQQTLRASVEWSHSLLTGPERILFRRLAVMTGGFELRARLPVAG